jgi:opacity protein-like surface antigen
MSLNETVDSASSSSSTTTSSTSEGYSAELGASYTFLQHVTASIGYKQQSLKSDAPGMETQAFNGPTFSLDYRF